MKPLARSDELVIEELGDELLVYDVKTDRAHSLSAAPARVWRRCDGETDVGFLSVELNLDPGTVARALEELDACELLEDGATLGNGSTRREVAIKAAKVGATAAAVPLIWSITGPIPEAAATVTIEFCLKGTTVHGCGNCSTQDTELCGCCCCQGTASPPSPLLCKSSDKCCLPATQCEAGLFGPNGMGSNCSTTPRCP